MIILAISNTYLYLTFLLWWRGDLLSRVHCRDSLTTTFGMTSVPTTSRWTIFKFKETEDWGDVKCKQIWLLYLLKFLLTVYCSLCSACACACAGARPFFSFLLYPLTDWGLPLNLNVRSGSFYPSSACWSCISNYSFVFEYYVAKSTNHLETPFAYKLAL